MLKKATLADLLLQEQAITQEQLNTAVAKQDSEGKTLSAALVELGYMKEEILLNYMAQYLNVPYVQLSHFQIKPDVIRCLPEAVARRFSAVPLEKIGNTYLVAMSEPSNLIALDEISRVLKSTPRVALVRESELLEVIDKVYRRTEDINSLAMQVSDEVGGDLAGGEAEGQTKEADAAPVIKLLESIFEDAIQLGASDVHIEPDREMFRIRMRVDGELNENVMDNKNIAGALVLRIKLLARLNISEKRLPQDGRFSMSLKSRNLDVRVSTMPTRNGEMVVMRLLDQEKGIVRLKQLGLSHKNLQKLQYNLDRPHGMILLTGPTGSGKSTTLYSCLSELNTPERKIITVEDPVEYTISRICQVQVQQKIGLDFALVLRSALRQDPDVVMVGEIRDSETAVIALRASLTGHLVFSTLHTNDSIAAPMRLVNMGIEPYLVATTLRLVIAQRLIRKICQVCKEDYVPNTQEKSWLDTINKADVSALKFYRGKGCAQCNHTGYKGRIAVHELLEMNQTLGDALRQGDSALFVKTARDDPEFVTLVQCAFKNAVDGLSSVEEIFKIATELSAEPDET